MIDDKILWQTYVSEHNRMQEWLADLQRQTGEIKAVMERLEVLSKEKFAKLEESVEQWEHVRHFAKWLAGIMAVVAAWITFAEKHVKWW